MRAIRQITDHRAARGPGRRTALTSGRSLPQPSGGGFVVARDAAGIGTPGDRYEREADRVADDIVRVDPATTSAPTARNPTDGANVGSVTRPLPRDARSFFETRFAREFSKVRIHTGPQAAALSSRFDANAITHGNDIHFAPGRYRPDSRAGRRLLAHELTHVLQQTGGGRAGTTGVTATPSGPMLQADFRASARRGWDMYTGMKDEGAPYAKKLMRWRMLGLGSDYATRVGDDWDDFMSARPEIHNAMAARFESLVTGFAAGPDTGSYWAGGWKGFQDSITGVKLNELESMRLTLHGCHRIDIIGRYWKGMEDGNVTVTLGGVKFVWVDRADLHPGTTTELASGDMVDDKEFTGAGWDYDIRIAFSMPSLSTWKIVGGKTTHVRGWPPVGGVPAAGFRG